MAGTRSHPHNVALAAVLAVLAGVFTLLYVAHGKGGAHAAVGRTAPTLVATRDIAVGTPASQALASGAIALRRVALAAVGPDSLANARPLAGEVAIQPVYKGEQIVAARFGPSGAVGYRSELRGADRILQVPGDPDQLLAGTLQDGDHIDVVASVHEGESQTPTVVTVLRNLLVLHAPAAGSSSPSTNDQVSATIELTDAQAQKLFYVMQNGNWSFSIRPAAKGTSSNVSPTTAASIVAGS
ncbi:MAG TPA: Flp pilus assembly protein CpaB [Gaiellaceae bacterium]|nr:Flp pilus assembly protein CpaB [Gaiellaceae bacterium]